MGLLFKSDNLRVLKALAKTHSKTVKCVYFDPPYNTGENRKHFRDDRNSREWLSMMRLRIKAAAALLRDDGSIWISIDDSELYNLKIMCDKIFGKSHFLGTVVWQHKINWNGYKGDFQLDHTYIVGYRKSAAFTFEDNIKPKTVWLESEVGGQSDAIAESRSLFGESNVFSTPKPESLMRYLLKVATKKGDVVLDGFSGSGTMGAVSQKMNRSWIMIEIGEQCEAHILPRMKSLTRQLTTQGELNSKDGFLYYSSVREFVKAMKK